ncbi:hypothetical protein C8T65DRAFT_72473 [Cerioporus squamosus]|nr:hypothetical protein C8T65DRAFT_72473 [Cerioporus squamosus]
MSSSARPFNRLKRFKEPRSSHSGSRADVKRTKLNTGSAAPGLALTVPEDASKVAEEAELLRLMEEWKKEQADISYRAVRQNQLVRIWKDLYTNFKLIPDEGLLRIQGPVDERMYYPSYKELLEAMFPKHLGFVVNLEISPTGTVAGHHAQVDIGGFYTARIGKIPLAFVEVKAAAAAIFADGRYVADSQVRARLRDIVE